MKVQALGFLIVVAALLGLACTAPAAAPAAKPAAPAPVAPAATGGGAAPAASAPAPAAAPAAAPDVVRVGLIGPQAGYWAVYAAEAQGYFAREGVANEVVYTRSPATSAQLLT